MSFVTPWTVAQSMGFPRQEHWSGWHFLLQRIFPTQGLNLCLLCWQVDSLPLSHQGSLYIYIHIYILFQILFLYRLLQNVEYIPCAIQWVLGDYLFYVQQCVYINPKLLIYPPSLFPLR